jgi:hypothetical protein
VATESIAERQEHAARNQSLFRDVNEQIETVASSLSMFHEYMCECASETCCERVSLTHDEYEAVRRHPARFAVKPGHALPGEEVVVDQAHARYVVVEKLQRGGEVAAHFDPRQRKRSDGRKGAISGFLYLLVQADGEPNDPAAFVSNEPPSLWKSGDEFVERVGLELQRFRIIDVQTPVEGFPAGWSAEYNGLWTVEPV